MSTPDQDLHAYEVEQERLDAADADAEREAADWERDNYPSCDYCGAYVDGANEPAHTIKDGATCGLTGKRSDTTMCHPCYVIDQRERCETFAALCRVAAQHVWTLIENAPTAALRTQAYEIHNAIGSMALDTQAGA